jgi:hypothetical protein
LVYEEEGQEWCLPRKSCCESIAEPVTNELSIRIMMLLALMAGIVLVNED